MGGDLESSLGAPLEDDHALISVESLVNEVEKLSVSLDGPASSALARVDCYLARCIRFGHLPQNLWSD